MIAVRHQRGVELPELGLWLDPHDPRDFAFVSHAHADHLGRHREIILTPGTSAFMRERMPGERVEHLLEYGQRATIRGLDITLIPAGHILGSAQIFLETKRGSLLYTGDFKLRSGLSAEPSEWRTADTLIMETTYGRPRYRLPPTEEVIARMIAFCRETLDDGGVPVLLGYSLGKAQEILCALDAAGLTPMLHGAVWKMTRIYQELRPDSLCSCVRYEAGEVAGKVLICPPSANRSLMLTKIKNRRVAMLSGWAMDPGAQFRYQCDAAFPLSDHADYTDLLRYVELVKPKRVLTLHGFAADFARDLRALGVEAWALTGENQLELSLTMGGLNRQDAGTPSSEGEGGTLASSSNLASWRLGGSSIGSTVAEPAAGSEFGEFARLGEAVGETASRLKKIALLADYLRGLDDSALPVATIALTGRAFAQADGRTLQTGWAVIKRAVLAVSRIGEPRFRELANLHSDAGRTTYEALLGATTPEPLALAELRDFFVELQTARGPLAKGDLLRERLAKLAPTEAQYLVKILTGDLRIGLKEGLVEEAVAAAFDAPPEEVREANMLLGDLGRAALLARRGELASAELTPFCPVKVMLASPEPSAGAVWKRLVGEAAWVEDKFDGIRAQLHRVGERVEIYTRDLKCVTGQFQDVVERGRGLHDDVILDGEIIAFEAGRKLTFFDLQKRLGRKGGGDLFVGSDIPVAYFAFDLLWLAGKPLLGEPLSQRRERLEVLDFPAGFERVAVTRAHSEDEIEAAFNAARARANEGLIIKDPASLYSPGRRGLAWLKLKKELATLDVVVVGAETGHGKRAHVLSDYTFAVRDDATGALLNIGKAYSGLTDVEIEELTAHFTKTTIAKKGRFREVRPEIVLEIAFDSIQPSKRHASGLAMRFPRIKAIRRDKLPESIDTLSYARSLAAL